MERNLPGGFTWSGSCAGPTTGRQLPPPGAEEAVQTWRSQVFDLSEESSSCREEEYIINTADSFTNVIRIAVKCAKT